MTDGLDVLVQEVIDAITTAPWSRMNSPLSSDRTLTGLVGRPSDPLAADCTSTAPSSANDRAAGSLAGERLLDGLVELRVTRGVVLLHVVVDVLAERVLRVRQQDSVLRALRACDGRNHVTEVEFEVLGVLGLVVGVVPEALFLRVRLDECELLLGAAGEAEVADGLGVDREDRGGGTELGAHVAERRAVGQRNLGDTLAVELDELTDDAVLAQHVGDGEDHVGGGDAGLDLTGQLETDDARDQHGDGLAEHGGLGLDAADAPAQHAQAVDHGGVRVGADAGVGVRLAVTDHDRPGQVLDVDLVDDAGARGGRP